MARPPKVIAQWRHELIEDALDPTLTAKERAATLRMLSRSAVRWPSGEMRRVSLATLYRWIALFERGGLAALEPKPRRDRGRQRRRLPAATVRDALELLEQDPTQSLYFLCRALEARLALRGVVVTIPRTTLQRRLAATKAYGRIRKSLKSPRGRTRFVAARPHQIWQLDALGHVEVRLVAGTTLRFHILSIIDDASRAILAARVVPSPTLGAAVAVFREAARRWGLPDQVYADRASIFDSHAFRGGVATLGVHRIRTRSGNAPAHGKIEAYHRTLRLWYVTRLTKGKQRIVDLRHLQQLLDGVIHRVYQPHRHRGLKQAPAVALADQRSTRTVPDARLIEAFLDERQRKLHPVTGELDLPDGTWIAPREVRGRRVVVLVDPAGEAAPRVVQPETGKHLVLRRAAVRPEDLPAAPAVPEPWADGSLQAIYDAWRGRPRPLAEAGFGLGEVYALLAKIAGRPVPASDAESARVQRFWQAHGPLGRRPTERALAAIGRVLGAGRSIKAYLDALAERIRPRPDSGPVTRRKRP